MINFSQGLDDWHGVQRGICLPVARARSRIRPGLFFMAGLPASLLQAEQRRQAGNAMVYKEWRELRRDDHRLILVIFDGEG